MIRYGLGIACALVCMCAVAETPVDESASVRPDAKITIDNAKGKTTITGWDQDRVEVHGVIGTGVTKFDFSAGESMVRIAVINPKRLRGIGESNLEIKVPHGASLSIEGVSANVILSDVTGSTEIETVSGGITVDGDLEYLRAESVSGGIRAKGAMGAVNSETVSGKIEISGSAERVSAETVSGSIDLDTVARRVEAETVSGTVTMAKVEGDLRAESVSGKIVVDGGAFDECKLTSCSASVQWKGKLNPHGELQADSHSGGVKLDFLEVPDATYTLDSFSGGISLNIPDAAGVNSGRSIRFTRGDGSSEVRVETFSGSINIDGK